MRVWWLAVLALACVAQAQARTCFSSERELIEEFFNSVNNCTEDPSRAANLYSMLTPDMVWTSADNVTFVSSMVFVGYMCFPHVGVTLSGRDNIRDTCEFNLDDNSGDLEYHIDTKNFLLYNLTRDPLDPNKVVNTKCFFQEDDDFTLTLNPAWHRRFNPNARKYLIREIVSYASPRDFYLELGYLPEGFDLTRKRAVQQGVKYFPYPEPNTIVGPTNFNMTIDQFLSLY